MKKKNWISSEFPIQWILFLIAGKHERENKEMKTRQARVSVETAKEVSQDKTLRNKAERERRLREKNSNNTKKFIEERKSAAMRQNKEKEKLKKMHEKQILDLSKEMENVSGHDNHVDDISIKRV